MLKEDGQRWQENCADEQPDVGSSDCHVESDSRTAGVECESARFSQPQAVLMLLQRSKLLQSLCDGLHAALKT